MDATTELLSDYASRLTFEGLSPEAVHQGNPSARILGTRQRTSTDLAAFANTALVRYLDCNDTYAARGTGHPSDMIPAVLAVADAHRAGGRAVITAIAAAYEA